MHTQFPNPPTPTHMVSFKVFFRPAGCSQTTAAIWIIYVLVSTVHVIPLWNPLNS